jgi:hypothetical protein
MSTAAATCHCARCRVADAGLGPGPYTPAQYALIAPATALSPSDDPVSGDPGVKAAQLAAREAREAFEPFDRAWLDAVAAHRREEIATPDRHYTDGRGGLFSLGGQRRLRRTGELAKVVKDTREERDLAWRKVVEANDAVKEALQAARVRVVEAQRGS